MILFIVNLKSPTVTVKQVDLEVKLCPKTVWAIRRDGRRYLLGSSVFQTLAAAERCRTALLQKLVSDGYTKSQRPHVWRRATSILQTLH